MRETEVRDIIRKGWRNQGRIDGWVSSQINGGFNDAEGRKAWIAALRKAVAGKRVRAALDIGTGPGTIAQLWAELGYASTGVDFSPAMLEAGRKIAAERGLSITFIEGDAEAPPFPEKSFDVVSSRLVLFTLPHPGYAVRRWTQLLRSGGRLVLIGYDNSTNPKRPRHHNKRNAKWRPSERYREALRQLPFVNHTPGELSVVMEAAGLRDIHRVPMDKVAAARTALGKREPKLGAFQSTPFILVGCK